MENKKRIPIVKTSSGKDPKTGKFLPKNSYAKGNIFAKRHAQWRAALYQECSFEKMCKIIRRLIDRCISGDPICIKILLDRTMGRTADVDAILDAIDKGKKNNSIEPDLRFL